MLEKDFEYAQRTLDKFVQTAIQRVAQTGDLVHHFKIPDSHIKEATDRARLKENVLEEYQEFFAASNIETRRDSKHAQLIVEVDLAKALLDPNQAAGLTTAITYRNETT